VDGIVGEVEALLDTGSGWSVIGGKEASLAQSYAEDLQQPVRIDTRFGTFDGGLHRLNVTFVADEGEDLEIDATVLLLPTWEGPVVIGYRGMLERVRFGLDPGHNEDQQWFCFGAD
jgi:hypothetical protein